MAMGAMPSVLKYARDSSAPVRGAALEALKLLAETGQTADLVSLVKVAGDARERGKAAAALMDICGRGGTACAGTIVAGLGDAGPEARVLLLRALGEAGGEEALKAVVDSLDTEDKPARDEAVRVLSSWRKASAVPHLLSVAAKSGNLLHQVLAIRGLVRLSSAAEGCAADVETLEKVLPLARRGEERRLILGALGGSNNVKALDLVVSLMQAEGMEEEAALAAVGIAEKVGKQGKEQVRAAMAKVLEKSGNETTRARAEKVLKTP
jgi:hypothetical protein